MKSTKLHYERLENSRDGDTLPLQLSKLTRQKFNPQHETDLTGPFVQFFLTVQQFVGVDCLSPSCGCDREQYLF